ncbi:outer membrane biogenesis lipoprotein LolB [Bacillus tianshenii]|uniref:Outer membrane biogenesis lipoprotein LolB n=1 Tax=Sutcliffiella tianshenii TaxID=1463404 RepID=A0ABS2P293_9BACI|nr:hypothetical protein [Bacillus tianshenii]MBM7620843.1 outer membrane biogenesis lipoprotein LolB [Bacillus tianshenii]
MMKKLFLLSVFLLFLTACGQPPEIKQRYSYVEVVEQQEDASLSEIEDIDLILRNGEVIVGLDEANEKYSRYNFEQAPAYAIFEYTGYLTDDMIMFTYDKEEAVALLEELIQEEKEKGE